MSEAKSALLTSLRMALDWADAGDGSAIVLLVASPVWHLTSSDNTAHVRMPTLTWWRLVSGSFGTFRLDFGRFKGFVLCIDLSLGVLRGDLEFLGVAAR